MPKILPFLLAALAGTAAFADYWRLATTTREGRPAAANDITFKIEDSGTGFVMQTQNNFFWVQKGGIFESRATWTQPLAVLTPGAKLSINAAHDVQRNALNQVSVGHALRVEGHRGVLGANPHLMFSADVVSNGSQHANPSGEWTVPDAGAGKIWITAHATNGQSGYRKVIYAYVLEKGSAPTTSSTPATPADQAAPPTQGPALISKDKPASQSSTSQWSHANDSLGALDGVKNGSFGFHTEKERNPWWQVDLGSLAAITEIRVFNRLDCCSERARTLQVLVSADGKTWQVAYRHDGSIFGGADGKPLRIPLGNPSARYVRLQLAEENWFHLDEVEVFGAFR